MNKPWIDEHGFDYWFATDLNAAPSHRNPTNFWRNRERVGKLEGYACQLVVAATVATNEGAGFFFCPDARHVIAEAIVVLHHGAGVLSGANADPRPKVVMATILRDGGTTALAYADARPYVPKTIIGPHHRACPIVPDPGVKVLEADVPLD